MKRTESLLVHDNETLHISISQDADFKAVILLIHGMGEHGGRYEHVTDFFQAHGFACVRPDLRGHGKSSGKKGHTPNYESLMKDLDILFQRTKELFPGIPVFLFGQSMGGNLVLNYLIRRKPNVSGAIASSPYLKLAFEPPKWKVTLGKLSAGIIPGLTQATGLEIEALSRDKAVIESYKNDPLVHDKITSAFFVNVHFAGPYAIENAGEIKVPLLIMHGTADRLTSHEGSKEFYSKSQQNVELKLWEGYYHELHNEPEKEEILNYELSWLKQQL